MEITLSPPEVPQIGACKLILIVELGWCWRVSTPSCFPFLRFGPALTDLPLEELLHLRGKKGLHCSNGGSSGKKTVFLLFEENNRRAIMDCNFSSINNLSLLLSRVCKEDRKFFFEFGVSEGSCWALAIGISCEQDGYASVGFFFFAALFQITLTALPPNNFPVNLHWEIKSGEVSYPSLSKKQVLHVFRALAGITTGPQMSHPNSKSL